MTYMGFDQTNFIKLHDMVWIYKNFLSEEEINRAIKNIESGKIVEVRDTKAKKIQFNGQFIHKKIVGLINSNNTYTGGDLVAFDTPINTFWPAHNDNPNDSNVAYQKVSGMVGYLNEFEGGELIYPDYGIIIKPEPGDLVIHHSIAVHAVALTKSDKRLTYTCELYRIKEDFPEDEKKKAIDFLVNQKYNIGHE
jgi:hypothetical protein